MKRYFIYKMCLMALILLGSLSVSGISAHTAEASDGQAISMLRVKSRPEVACSFNIDSIRLAENEQLDISAYPKPGFRFVGWEDEQGNPVSDQSYFYYIMPGHDAALYAVSEYDPKNPGNPGNNSFDAATGLVIADDFEPGDLYESIWELLNRTDASSSQVLSLIISGEMNYSDLGILNYYDHCTSLDLSRTWGYDQIPSYAFDYNESLQSVVLPAGINAIGSNAFYHCTSLSSITCYALVPPSVGYNAFKDIAPGCVLYVPSGVLPLYAEAEGWKDFFDIILPISDNVRDLIVTLPETSLTNLYLEVVNTESGQKLRYLLKDGCTSYTFYGLLTHMSYDVFVRTASGAELASRLGVEIEDEDVRVEFTSLRAAYDVSLHVWSSDGFDVTDEVNITWTSTTQDYLGQGSLLPGVLENETVCYQIELPQSLGMMYQQPGQQTFQVTASRHDADFFLQEFGRTSFSGCVTDESSNSPLYLASVAISQKLNSKYVVSQTVTTGTDGRFLASIYAGQPAVVNVSYPNYFSKETDLNIFGANTNFALAPVTGITLYAQLRLQHSVVVGDDLLNSDYYDYQNITYKIYDQTLDEEILDYVTQSSQLILPKRVKQGDVLAITLSSLNNTFDTTTIYVTVPEESDTFSCTLVERGGIRASYVSTECNSVVGLLFDAQGNLLSRKKFSNMELNLNSLSQGSYTLLSMDEDPNLNAFVCLSQLSELGLQEGVDYVRNQMQVFSGQISVVENSSIPRSNKPLFSITGSNTAISSNKYSVVAGNYLTLKALVDFKSEYDGYVSNLQLQVDLPQGFQLVPNSVMLGTDLVGYTVDGNRIEIPMERYGLSNAVRLCVLPLEGGEYYTSATIRCNTGGQSRIQSIGSTKVQVKNLNISVPKEVSSSDVIVHGSAPEGSSVEVYDEGQLIATTTAIGNGTWSVNCQLARPFNMSVHSIYAKVLTPQGLSLQTDTKSVSIDRNRIRPTYCDMSFYNSWLHDNQRVHWNFETGKTDVKSYMFYTTSPFYFNLHFTHQGNDVLKDVMLDLYCIDGSIHTIKMMFDPAQDAYVGVREFNSHSLVNNMKVRYKVIAEEPIYDQDSYEAQQQSMDLGVDDFVSQLNTRQIDTELVQDTEQMLAMKFLLDGQQDQSQLQIVSVDYTSALADTRQRQYHYVFDGSGYLAFRVTDTDNSFVIRIVDVAEETAVDVICVNYGMPTQDVPLRAASTKSSKWLLSLVKDGKWAGNSLQIIGVIGDLLDLRKYWGLEHIETWCERFDQQMDRLYEARNKVGPMIYKKCKDGSYRLSENDRQRLKKRLDAINSLIDMYFNNFYDYLEEYKETLANSVKWDIAMQLASLGMGHWVGEAVDHAFGNWKWVKALAAKSDNITRSKNLTDAVVGEVASKLLGLTDLLTPDNTDFEARRDELKAYMSSQYSAINRSIAELESSIRGSYMSCNDDDDDDDDDDNDDDDDDPPFPPITPILDPSGYVYEAVSSNRLKGVIATAYYREEVEDMYGNKTLQAKKWDAEEYAQQNPLFTDALGMYQWDVPQGEWQVKFEKSGYETTYSDWLPVPPPQLEVNVPMTQYIAPSVASVQAYESGILITFDKYMQPASLSQATVKVVQAGRTVEGSIRLVDDEPVEAGSSTSYVRQIRFEADQTLQYASEVILTISHTAKSYAGVSMVDDFSQTFIVEREVDSFVAPEDVVLTVGFSQDVEITAQPSSAAQGKNVLVTMNNSECLSADQTLLTLDGRGKSTCRFFARSQGQVLVSFYLEGSSLITKTLVTIMPDFSLGIEQIVNEDWSVDTGYLIVSRANGQLVRRINDVGSLEAFDLSELADGIYVLTFIGTHHTVSKKVMKQNR